MSIVQIKLHCVFDKKAKLMQDNGTIQSTISVIRTDRRRLVLVTLCMGVLIAQIDTSVVNLAVRPIGIYFSASVAELQWVVVSYNLAYAVFLLTGGLLADLLGRKTIFMVGVAIFTSASLLCAFAPSIQFLIGGRAFAGLGAALLMPASLSIIRVVWPNHTERGWVLGVWAACNGLALAIGPTLGGLLIGQFGWRSIFLVVVPLGLVALASAVPTIAESSDPDGRHFDAPGQILGAIALGGLAFAAIEAREAIFTAIIALTVSLLALAGFITAEAKKGAAALVPLDMFRIREFRGAMTATAGMTFGMYGVLFLLPLTWQSTGMLNPAGAGVALMPMALVFVLVSPFSGAFSRNFRVHFMTSSGVALIGFGLLVLSAAAGQGSIMADEIGLILTGLGMGLATGPLAGLAVGSVSVVRSGTAAALFNVARMAGAVIGVAVLGAVFAAGHDPATGLRFSMLLGGLVQLTCAAVAWVITRANATAG
ncbi:MAG: Sugar (And other) transporter family protein [Candidatus Gallionella acididurans]|uniref:Sugar (And other) transporter family protein n=1 Tax=Candidatus Gallionella acididurans TaxID=1796491 RepID=A0A139BQJ3_9PROT|nr:MAG: Sugar (And other) transporter family protein [Candidatus Gallionella acididurans]